MVELGEILEYFKSDIEAGNITEDEILDKIETRAWSFEKDLKRLLNVI